MKRPENARMEAFLLHHGIPAQARYAAKGSMKGTWQIWSRKFQWSDEVRERLTALGFMNAWREPLSAHSNNGGYFEVTVTGHNEFLTHDPVLLGVRRPQLELKPVEKVVPETGESLSKSSHMIAAARDMWASRCATFIQAHGIQGTCVIGAGIAVKYLPPRCRNAEDRIIIQALDVAGSDGASVWEESVKDVVEFLKPVFPSVFYACGRMD